MTSVAERFAVRVMVPDAWDQVFLAVDPTTTIAEVKRQALERALKRPAGADEYLVKFRGGLVIDETATLAGVGVGANAPLIVLRAHRRPVR
jgi:hypothetical protein